MARSPHRSRTAARSPHRSQRYIVMARSLHSGHHKTRSSARRRGNSDMTARHNHRSQRSAFTARSLHHRSRRRARTARYHRRSLRSAPSTRSPHRSRPPARFPHRSQRSVMTARSSDSHRGQRYLVPRVLQRDHYATVHRSARQDRRRTLHHRFRQPDTAGWTETDISNPLRNPRCNIHPRQTAPPTRPASRTRYRRSAARRTEPTPPRRSRVVPLSTELAPNVASRTRWLPTGARIQQTIRRH